MARDLFGIESGLRIYGVNADTGVSIISGSVDPSASSGVVAEEGSLYLRTNGTLFKKIGALDTDWEILPDNTDVADLITLSGVSAASTNLGTFTGVTIADSETIKGALQDLETALEANIPVKAIENAITTARVIDQVKTTLFASAEWLVSIQLDSDISKRVTMKVLGQHDGTIVADAVNVDDVVYGKLHTGAAFNHVVSVELSGTGAAQYMQLKVSASSAVSVRATRLGVTF
jgi:hypothetical protein